MSNITKLNSRTKCYRDLINVVCLHRVVDFTHKCKCIVFYSALLTLIENHYINYVAALCCRRTICISKLKSFCNGESELITALPALLN